MWQGAVEDGFLDLEANSEVGEKQRALEVASPVDKRNARVQELSVDVPATMSPRSLEESIFSARRVSLPRPDLSPDTDNQSDEGSRTWDGCDGSEGVRGDNDVDTAGRVARRNSSRERDAAEASWASQRNGGGQQHALAAESGRRNGGITGVDGGSRGDKTAETPKAMVGGFALEDLLAAWGRGER